MDGTTLREDTPDPAATPRAQSETLCGWMEDAGNGERLTFVYVPGEGTTVQVHGKAKGPIARKEFADALFRTWLGPKAIPGEEFKRHLLGL